MKKYVNGEYIELTIGEIEELKKQSLEIAPQELSVEERVLNLEEQFNSISAVLTQVLTALNK